MFYLTGTWKHKPIKIITKLKDRLNGINEGRFC
jgi:hypothetical protein